MVFARVLALFLAGKKWLVSCWFLWLFTNDRLWPWVRPAMWLQGERALSGPRQGGPKTTVPSGGSGGVWGGALAVAALGLSAVRSRLSPAAPRGSGSGGTCLSPLVDPVALNRLPAPPVSAFSL